MRTRQPRAFRTTYGSAGGGSLHRLSSYNREKHRYPKPRGNPVCPHCGSKQLRWRTTKGNYKCGKCGRLSYTF